MSSRQVRSSFSLSARKPARTVETSLPTTRRRVASSRFAHRTRQCPGASWLPGTVRGICRSGVSVGAGVICGGHRRRLPGSEDGPRYSDHSEHQVADEQHPWRKQRPCVRIDRIPYHELAGPCRHRHADRHLATVTDRMSKRNIESILVTDPAGRLIGALRQNLSRRPRTVDPR